MACKKNRVAGNIHVWSRHSSTRAKLAELNWCDNVFPTPLAAAESADLVVICAPVDFIIPLYNEIRPALKPGALVTDVGSTKSTICRQAASGDETNGTFIGSHPMAGSEKTGMAHADPDLFLNRPCIVTRDCRSHKPFAPPHCIQSLPFSRSETRRLDPTGEFRIDGHNENRSWRSGYVESHHRI